MTLDELVSYVTTKSQLVEADDIAAAKLFLSKRYELIYNSYLWKDSLAMVNVTVDPVNNLDNAQGVVLLPQMIDRVVALRNADQSIRIKGLEDFYRVDWNRFIDSGMTTAEFCILNPVWLDIRANANPYTAPVVPVPSGGGTYNIETTIGDALKFDAVSYAITITDPFGAIPPISVPSGSSAYVKADVSDVRGFVISIPIGQPLTVVVNKLTLPANQTTGAGSSVVIQSTNPVDDNMVQVKVVWRDNSERYVTTAVLPVTLGPNDGTGNFEIEAVFKPVTVGNLQVAVTSPVGTSSVTQIAGTLSTTTLMSPKYQRIRVFSIPTGLTTLNVLGKKPFVPLDFGSESPALKNLDNCLIAFAMADLLARVRQYSKSQAQMQEGATLLSELAKLETVQSANNSRFVPDGGYGDEFFAPSSNRGLWA